jgi:hypothetical protein
MKVHSQTSISARSETEQTKKEVFVLGTLNVRLIVEPYRDS